MATELEKFEAKKRRRSVEAGLLTTGSLAARHGIMHELMDRAENAATPKTNGYQDYLDKLQPGDVLFNREFGKDDRGKAHLYDAISGAKGEHHLHPVVYRGGGRIAEAGGGDVPAKARTKMDSSGYPLESQAYRLKNLGAAEKAKALGFLDQAAGTPYKDVPGIAKHVLGHLAGISPKTTGDVKKACGDGIVCSELVAEAYPKRFTDRYMSPVDMRHHPDMEMVARYGHTLPVPLKEKLLSRGVYPVLKNLKYGLGAGALAYGGMSLAEYLRKHGKKGPDNAESTG